MYTWLSFSLQGSRIWQTEDTARFVHNHSRVAIMGHSYVRQLANMEKTTMDVRNFIFKMRYFHHSGASYDTFLQNDEWFREIAKYEPHYVVVILAGNSISSDAGRQVVRSQCAEFYRRLKYNLPNTIIISAQCEMRYYQAGNKWKAPLENQYFSDRNYINNVINRQIKERDYLIKIIGRDRLDNKELYMKDGVHLKPAGWKMYMGFIEGTFAYIIDDLNDRQLTEYSYERVSLNLKRRREDNDGESSKKRREENAGGSSNIREVNIGGSSNMREVNVGGSSNNRREVNVGESSNKRREENDGENSKKGKY